MTSELERAHFLTFNDFEHFCGDGETRKIENFVCYAIERHKMSDMYRIAKSADLYDAQKNEGITNFTNFVYNSHAEKKIDFTSSNNKIVSNFFERLNMQRCSYSLGNGVIFEDEQTKAKLGNKEFDESIYDAAYYSLIHGASFVMLNIERLHVFPLTEFVPLYDETTGVLMAGIRFWRIARDKPWQAVLYEVDGYTALAGESYKKRQLHIVDEKRPYKREIQYIPAENLPEIVGEENYSALPIVPMFGSRLKQSTLVGMKETIDAYDMVKSGFANDLQDVAQCYWIVENRGGMTDEDLDEFRDKLLLHHIANANTQDGGKIQAYNNEIPYNARETLLIDLRKSLYDDFCCLDVLNVSASIKTATEIQASYQPMDNKANDFEKQITKCIKQLLSIAGIDDVPSYQRNKVASESEQVSMVMMEAQYLDEETVLKKLPNISPDEVKEILKRKDAEDQERMQRNPFMNQDNQDNQDEEDEDDKNREEQ